MKCLSLDRLAACAALLALSSCATEEVAQPIDTYLSEEPIGIGQEISCRSMTGKNDRIEIGIGGALSLTKAGEGPALSECPMPIYVVPPEPRPELTAAQKEFLSSMTFVSAARDALFADVVSNLNELSKSGPIVLTNDSSSRAFDAYVDHAEHLSAGGFVGDAGNQKVAVWVGFLEEQDQCIYMLNGSTISSDDLYVLSFDVLEKLVEENGGVESIHANPELLKTAVFAIQADESTPWHCIMGADYQAKATGWPFIRFEVMGDLAS